MSLKNTSPSTNVTFDTSPWVSSYVDGSSQGRFIWARIVVGSAGSNSSWPQV